MGVPFVLNIPTHLYNRVPPDVACVASQSVYLSACLSVRTMQFWVPFSQGLFPLSRPRTLDTDITIIQVCQSTKAILRVDNSANCYNLWQHFLNNVVC